MHHKALPLLKQRVAMPLLKQGMAMPLLSKRMQLMGMGYPSLRVRPRLREQATLKDAAWDLASDLASLSKRSATVTSAATAPASTIAARSGRIRAMPQSAHASMCGAGCAASVSRRRRGAGGHTNHNQNITKHEKPTRIRTQSVAGMIA